MTGNTWTPVDDLAEADFAIAGHGVALVNAAPRSGLPSWAVYALDSDGLPDVALYEGEAVPEAVRIAADLYPEAVQAHHAWNQQ